MKKRYKFVNIFKAILTRILVLTHITFLYLSFIWRIDDFGLLFLSVTIAITLIIIEGIYTIVVRYGQEWKW